MSVFTSRITMMKMPAVPEDSMAAKRFSLAIKPPAVGMPKRLIKQMMKSEASSGLRL